MNCRLCDHPFSSEEGNLPRVLILCGHTLCQNCIQASLQQSHIKCVECGQVSQGSSLSQYPVNATLISLLKQEVSCKIHNQKIEAYCQKDNQLLCLTCVINGQHKSHKITQISEKVSKDRTILKQCAKSIHTSVEELNELGKFCHYEIERLEHEYKDYLLELGLCFNSIRSTLKELQEGCLGRAKAEYEKYVRKYEEMMQQVSEKNNFMGELIEIYEQVMSLPNLQYLYEDNKRIFIMENCKLKKPKIEAMKLQFNKNSIYNEAQNAIQELINFEKRLQGQTTPGLKHKKSSRTKEPTILEVNLNEHYKKHYKSNSNTNQNKKQKSIICIKTPKLSKQKSQERKQLIPVAISNSGSKLNNQSFHSDAYIPASMVNSFMESSDHSISIKGSEADFTICSFESQVFHFGSYADSSVELSKVGVHSGSQLVSSGINRSKAQCVILPDYSPFNCLILGGKSTSDQKLSSFIEYDLHTNKWKQNLFRLSEPKSGFGCVVKDNNLYIAGGSNSTKSLKNFESYRVSGLGLCKTQLTPMNHSRDEMSMVLGYDGFIYAFGGINESGSVLSSCERYNWVKSRWEMVPNMKKPRRCFAAVSLPHGIFVIGGYDGTDYLNDVELFDFTTEKWISMPPMEKARFAHTAVVTADTQQILVCGGFNNGPLKSVEKYSMVEEQWSRGEELKAERFLHCSLLASL